MSPITASKLESHTSTLPPEVEHAAPHAANDRPFSREGEAAAPGGAGGAAKRRPMRKRRSLGGLFITYLLPLISVGLLVFAAKFVIDTRKTDSDVAPPVVPAKAPYSNTVAGNGMIEAQTENISVGTPVPGLVTEVFVNEGDKVVAKQPLFRLDDRHLLAELKVREANVAAAKAELLRLENEPRPEEIPVREAMVAEAEANLTQQTDNLRRTQDLYGKRVATEQELTQAQQNYRVAFAKLEHAKAQMRLLNAGAWQYQKDVAQAAVEQANALVEQAKIDLDRLTIRALDNGEVLQVNVRPGEYVGAPHVEPLMLLGDVDRLHVRVDIDENDIPRFVAGKPATASLKGSPHIRFPLHYVKTEPYVVPKRSLTGLNTERVDTRVLQVIYSFDPAGLPVHVGQQVEIFIEADDAVEAPPSEPVSPAGRNTGNA